MTTIKQSFRDLQGTIKYTNMGMMEVPEGKEEENGPESIFEEIMLEFFPNW